MPNSNDEVKEDNETRNKEAGIDVQSMSKSDNEPAVTPEFQYGVQKAQAMTQVWTKENLILAYVVIWLIQFIQGFSSGISSTLTPWVTSAFAEHSLTATTSIVSGLVGGLVKLPYAKLMDVWGRPQGFAIMVACATLGLIMMAGCNNVKTYCAAQVFYYVGYNGIDFTLTIFVADTSSLKNRAFLIAFMATPWIATVWAYGPAAQSILSTIGFRWGFGVWAIVYPIVCAPLIALFIYNERKAKKAGLLPERVSSNRTAMQSIIYYCREFDVIGILLLATGLSLFLLSFSLYSYQTEQWKSPMIICFVIFGSLLIVAFALYEKYLAPVTFIPWTLLMDRTVFFTFTMVASIYLAWYLWDSYFYSFLIVVFNQTVSQATYITNIYTVGACFWAVIVGIIIRYNGRLKWLSLYFGVPITILGVALMIKFRQPDTNIGYIVMCQIFIAFGGGTLVICEQMTVMAVSSQQNIPAILAMEAMVANIGGSIGSTVAAAIWTGVFPNKLAKYLPASSQADLATIYGSLTAQSSYPVGSPARIAINHAYADTQRLMLIAATCLYSITLGSVILWKDVNVKKINQIKGIIF
ncbi:putative siderophore iron [Phaeomoniella chlamydospora]|uniref:Putative siderophore iron n=1 Tax=Phaeomoniella chlamydospora TaxID=158046 RepID=A0A0G2G656_PHACM|nr:putative siderophore iron [Phaeomoniella chlamydospora]